MTQHNRGIYITGALHRRRTGSPGQHGIRRFVISALGASGFKVWPAENAERGLIEASTRQPELIILDLGLPDRDGLDVTRAGEAVHLTPIEYRMLTVLLTHAGRVLTHRQLLNEVWGPSHVERIHYLRVFMAGLRRKLEAEPARPQHLLTVSGVGYRLEI